MCASSHQDDESTTIINGIAVRRGKSLRTCYLFVAGSISFVVAVSILASWATGSDNFNSASVSGQVFLALFAPIFIIASTLVHEMIHAVCAKRLMDGVDVTVKFSRWGAAMSAVVNEKSRLWRKLVTLLSPAITVAAGSFMLIIAMVFMGAFHTDGLIRMMWEAAATSLVVVALINLINLLPFGKLDGGIALKETLDSLKTFKGRHAMGVAAV